MPIQRKGMRALQIWCARVTADYPCVDVVDLTTSFRDGLAFVGIVHHFRPDLIRSPCDLDPKDVLGNNALAFRVAEEKLDVPALLDPQDMADCSEEDGPDKFSVVTYVSQFYHLFKDADDSRVSPSSPVPTRFGSESENDSLMGGSSGSETGTPLGTPTPAAKKQLVFNQAELIAKYGEEIFSTSSPTPTAAKPTEGKRPTGGVQGKVGALCSAFDSKAKIRS